MKTSEFILNWAIDTIKRDYADDIALVLTHDESKMDHSTPHFSFFIPITKRGDDFAKTFILKGIGFDIWSIHWDRIENFVNLNEYNIHVLADAKIAYAKSPEYAQKFEMYQKMQLLNLSDESKTRKLALESYARAKSIFTEMLFSNESDSKMCAGYVIDFLARSIAFINHSYFHRMQAEQLEELANMKHVPDGFAELYMSIINAADLKEQTELCHKIISLVHDFLLNIKPQCTSDLAPERNFQDLSDWYAELAYTWLRIRTYAAQNDRVKVHMWSILLQKELNDVCDDFGLPKMDLMYAYDPDDLSKIVSRADELEVQMREILIKNGSVINEYASEEEFLNEV